MENLPEAHGEYQHLDGGRLLYHVQSKTYFILAIDEEGILAWVVSPFDHQSDPTDPFDKLGVSPHYKGIDPTQSNALRKPK